MNEKIDRVARIIDPEAMAKYERDFAKSRSPTWDQITAFPSVQKARQKAQEILALLARS